MCSRLVFCPEKGLRQFQVEKGVLKKSLLQKSFLVPFSVIPAKAGIQVKGIGSRFLSGRRLDPGFRRGDEVCDICKNLKKFEIREQEWHTILLTVIHNGI
jgi:hypothetical protein